MYDSDLELNEISDYEVYFDQISDTNDTHNTILTYIIEKRRSVNFLPCYYNNGITFRRWYCV